MNLDQGEAALSLAVIDTVSAAPAGQQVAVTLEMRSGSSEDVTAVSYAHPELLLLNEHGTQVTSFGWTHPTLNEVVLGPGQAVAIHVELPLRGPRGGANNVPLVPGQHLLQGRLNATIYKPDGTVSRQALIATADLQVLPRR